MFLIMMRTPTRKDYNINGNTKLKEWLQEILDHVKSCKQKYFLLALFLSSQTL